MVVKLCYSLNQGTIKLTEKYLPDTFNHCTFSFELSFLLQMANIHGDAASCILLQFDFSQVQVSETVNGNYYMHD